MNRRIVVGMMVAAAIALAACASGPRRVVVKGDVGLSEMVDQKVEFTGLLQGPAKLGDFLTVADRPIYLDKLSAAGRYGQRATVAGTLRKFVPPTAEDCKDGCEHANMPPHYWIEGGKFVTPAAGTQ